MQRGCSHCCHRHSVFALISVLLLLVITFVCVSITTTTSTRNSKSDASNVTPIYTSLNDMATLVSDTWRHPINDVASRVRLQQQRRRRQLQTTPPTVEVKGELRKWHKVTLAIQGPMTSENDVNDNPFTNYRLDVTFAHALTSTTYKVPGYYATDGDAAETGEKDGNVWYVHFAPDQTGEWTYTIDFKKGVFIAIQPGQLGAPVYPAHTMNAKINILPSDKTGRDHRGKGRLKYVGKHHFQFQETKEYFLKAGSDR